MARQLTFQIVAETYEAEAKLRVLEGEIAELNKQLKAGTITWEQYEKSLKSASTSAAAQKQTVDELKQGTQEQSKALTTLQAAMLRYAGPAAMGYTIKRTLDWASSLEDLAARSGISTTTLQRLEVAAVKSGGSLEQVANASAMLLDRLGSNDKNLIKAVNSLGLNLDEIRAMDPGTAFLTIAKSLAAVEDPAKRMALAVDLLGRQGRTLMPLILEIGKGLDDVATVTPEAVAQADDLGDSWEVLLLTGQRLLAQVLGPLTPAFTSAAKTAGWFTSAMVAQYQVLRDIEQLGVRGAFTKYLETQLKAPTVAGPGGLTNAPFAIPTIGDPTSAEYKAVVKDLTRAHREAAAAAREYAKTHQLLASTNAQRLNYLAYGIGGLSTSPDTDLVAQMYLDDLPILRDLGVLGGPTTAPSVKASGMTVDASWIDKNGQELSQVVSNSLLSAYQGGGNEVASLVSGISTYGAKQLAGTGFGDTTAGKLIGGGISGIGSAILGYQVGGQKGKAAGALSGAASGAMAGAMFGPWGMAAGAMVGMIGGLIGGRDSNVVKKQRQEFLEAVGGIDELRKMADYAGVSVDKLMNTKKPKELEREIKKLQDAFAATKKRIEETTKSLSDLAREGGLMSKELFANIQKDIKNEDVQQAVFAFMQKQAQTATEALTAYITKAQILTTGGAQALAGSIAVIFEELQRQGATTTEALAAVQPAITALGQKLDEMGVGGGAAFETLRRFAAIAGDEVAGPLLDGAGNLERLMTSLANLGLMNQDIFAGLAGEVRATYDRLVELGHNPLDVLQLMQRPLQTIYELQKNFGYEVDEATQALLNQAKEAGVVGDQFQSAQDKMVDAVNKLIDRLDVLIRQLGGDLPEAISDIPTIVLPYAWEYQGAHPPPDDYGGVQLARGGVVRRPTVALIGEAGPEAVVPLDRAGGLGGVVVQVDARGALLNDPASQQNLATIISDAVTRQLSLHTRYAVA